MGGTIAWVGAKLAKPIGGRARPDGVLPDVTLREGIEGDLGWVSGHTAVATTLAFIAARSCPGPPDRSWPGSWGPWGSGACTWARTSLTTSWVARAWG